MKVNYYDWFNKDGSARYDVAKEFNLPIIAHAALRTGAASALKPEALSILKDANPDRSSVDWGASLCKIFRWHCLGYLQYAFRSRGKRKRFRL